MKSECPTFLRSNGKAINVTLSDDEVFDNESGSVVADENPSDGELSENADLQESYNEFCKVAAKDDMNDDLGLKKIASLELDKKICC